MNNRLCWTPLADPLLNIGKNGILLISPFIQKGALRLLVESFENVDSLQVVTRWNPGDIVSGVSDLEVYPYLNDLGVPLYINYQIHLKLTIFDDDVAFHASANITNKGLGISTDSNVEVGCLVELYGNDWMKIHELLEASIRVDDLIYTQAKEYLTANKEKRPPLPSLGYKPKGGSKEFSRHSLPFVQNPELLWNYYSEDRFDGSRASFVHDLVLYSIKEAGLSRSDFLRRLEANFKRHPFIESIAGFIRQEKDLRFGAVNNWMTAKCSDKPVPFRWELKPATNRLYDWLDHFFDEISWDQPNYTQIIRWKENE